MIKKIEKEETNSLIRLLNETDIDVIHCLNNTYPHAKEEFLTNEELTVPPCRRDNLNPEKIKKNIDLLEQTDTTGLDLEPESRKIFEDLLRFNYDKNSFVLANYEYTHAADADRNAIKERHQSFGNLLYGQPDKEQYFDILSHTLNQIDPKSLDHEHSKTFAELMELLPELPADTRGIYRPDPNVLQKLHERCLRFYEPFLRHIPNRDTFCMEDICTITEEILDTEYHAARGNWKVVYEKDRSTACVDQLNRKIIFPGNRNIPYYTRDSLIKLIIHEVGVHFLRELPFDQLEIDPIRTGLRGYEACEEGIATTLSEAVTDTFSTPGLIHYVSIGLAYFYGLTFREIYEIQKRLQFLAWGTLSGRSFDSVNRALRGTYALANCKDLAYYNGSFQVRKYIAEHIDDSDLFDQLLGSGKIDLFNPDQRAVMMSVKEQIVI